MILEDINLYLNYSTII